jgi:hypothetical protein
MRRKRRLGLVVSFAMLLVAGCWTTRNTRSSVEPPPTDMRPTRIEYLDTDAFDALLESALVNQDPVIVIQTRYEKPEWGERLNAWIAAWNRGGRVEAGKKVRMQSPLLPRIVVDGDSIREFRLLIESLMNRVEESVKERSAWWAEEKVRERRVGLLKPYNLRFHMGEDGAIQIILFNGRYAQYHREFVISISAGDASEEWERGYSCSACKSAAKAERTEGKLTSSGE